MKAKQDRHGVRTAVDLERKYKFEKQFKTFNGYAQDNRNGIAEVAYDTASLATYCAKTYTPLDNHATLSADVDNVKKTYTLQTVHDSLAEAVAEVNNEVSNVKTSLNDYTLKTAHNALSEEVSDLETLVNSHTTFTSGESNGWYYRKWSDGRAECWKTLTHKTTITTAWGTLYHGTATSRQAYPFNFVDKPIENVSLTAGSYQAILFPEKEGNGVNGASASACYNLCRPSAITSSVEFYISFYVVGRWK